MFILDTDHLGILQRHRSPEYDQLVATMLTLDDSDENGCLPVVDRS